MKSIVAWKRLRDLRNAMISLREADPESWEVFLTQFLRDTEVIPPVFHADKDRAYISEAKKRLGMSYLKLLAEDDPQSIINRLEAETRKTTDERPTLYNPT